MVAKSHGPRRRTRKKFRVKDKLTVNRYLARFEIGQNVAIKIHSSSAKGQPFRRFHGNIGKVIGQRGRAYIIEIYDGNKAKKIIADPEHLKAL